MESDSIPYLLLKILKQAIQSRTFIIISLSRNTDTIAFVTLRPTLVVKRIPDFVHFRNDFTILELDIICRT